MIGKTAAQTVVAVQIAEHKPATVRVDQDGQVLTRRPIDAHRDVAAGSPNNLLAYLGDGLGLGRWHVSGPDHGPGLCAGHGVHRRKARVQHVEQRGDLWVEVHAYRSRGRGDCSVGATRPPSTLRHTPIAVMRTGATSRWSNIMRFIGPHTDTAATASPGLPIGAATQPNPARDSSRSKAKPWARILASSAESCVWVAIEYLVLRTVRSIGS